MEDDATAVLRAEPDNAFANYLLARALLERNELDRAEACLQRSLISSRTPGTLNALAETLRRQKRFDVAEKRVREALAQSPDFYPAWDTLGCILLDAGRSEEAAQAIEQALTLCKTEPRLYVSLARVRIAQARPDDARHALREISVRCKFLPADVTRDIATLKRQLAPTGQPAP
jgi:Flp pilus assembly protein TadD